MKQSTGNSNQTNKSNQTNQQTEKQLTEKEIQAKKEKEKKEKLIKEQDELLNKIEDVFNEYINFRLQWISNEGWHFKRNDCEHIVKILEGMNNVINLINFFYRL